MKRKQGTADILEQTIKGFENHEITNIEYVKAVLEWEKHERLIHLLVTIFVGIILFISLACSIITQTLSCLILTAILLVLEAFYLYHYYRLENGVQKLNKLLIKTIAMRAD